MKENQALKMEDFLQQFPGQEMYDHEGQPFENWWETDGDPTVLGEPINLATMFGGQPQTQG